MVRSKVAIEKYINLIWVAYSAMILIPFISIRANKEKLNWRSPVKYRIEYESKIA